MIIKLIFLLEKMKLSKISNTVFPLTNDQKVSTLLSGMIEKHDNEKYNRF